MRSVPTRYAACRSWMHAWDFTTVERKGGEFVQGLRCVRCGTEKQVRINSRTGLREHGSQYKYPEQLDPNAEPYQMPRDSGGALTAQERGHILLGDIKAHYAGEQDELKRRRAKKRA